MASLHTHLRNPQMGFQNCGKAPLVFEVRIHWNMDSGGNGELGPENRGGGPLDFSSMGNFAPLPSDKVLGMNVGTEPLYKHWNGVYSSIISGWASPIASHVQSDNSSYTDILQNQGTSSTQFQSDCSLAELESNLPCFGSGSFSEMDSFFIQQTWHRTANCAGSADCTQEGSGNETEKVLNSQNAADYYPQIREEGKFLVEATMEPSSDGKKRKGDIWSQYAQNVKTDQVKDECIGEKDVEKRKPERKLAAKKVKDSSTCGDAPKEDSAHARAKRGQATNSHSLAERVRRGKIKERMKFLQDLVPGCSKLTGKAVMLDEIINYVLSLQRQVEFLSVKLTTVHPEVNDPEPILLRDIDHSQGVSVAILGDPRMSSYPKEMLQGTLLATQTSNLETPIMPNVGQRHLKVKFQALHQRSDLLAGGKHMGQ